MLDSIGSAIDSAAGALGGGTPAPAAKDVDPVFHVGEQLDAPEDRKPIPFSPKANSSDNAQNQLGQDAPTEFIHFGATHQDLAPKFDHPKTAVAHGVMFRDALEREALLLHGCLTCAQGVFKEHKDSQGALGDIGAAANVLFGSGAKGPDPARFDDLDKKITKAGGSINKEDAFYPDIHQAGIDLHKVRANYAAFVKTMADDAFKKGDSGGVGAVGSTVGAFTGAASNIGGGAAKAANFVQGLVFKPFDIYLAMYLALRTEYEDVLEIASYKMTLKAIRAKSVPTFHIWFALPKPAESNSDAPDDHPDNAVEKAIDDAKKAVEDAKKAVDKKVKDVKDFLSPDAPDDPTPGDEDLASIFTALTSGAEDKRKDDAGNFRTREQIVPLLTKSIEDTLGVSPMPGFIAKALQKIIEKDIALVQFVFKKAQSAGLTMDFSQDSLRKLGQEWFFDTLLDILVDSFSFLQDSPDGLFSIQGQKLTKKAFLEKGRDLLKDKLGDKLNPILDAAMNNFGDRLRGSIDGAKGNNALTMEVIIARLPELLALIVRDTMLPVYDLLFDELFGKAMGALGGAMSPVKSMVGKASGVADDVKSTKDKIEKAQKKLADGVDQNTDFGKLKDDIMGDDKKTDPGATGGDFPGGTRVILCQGKPIKDEDIKKVENDQKVDAKVWPDPPPPKDKVPGAGT